MPPQITAMFARLGSTVRGFSIAQRTLAIIGVAGLVLGGIALTSWLGKPAYTPLFSGLQAADASSIVDQLRTDGVPYELTNGGGTILVPDAKVYDERLKAAAAGLPASKTAGYSLLDNMGVTSSEFQQSVTYKRAMEGELASTIEAMDGVQTASVKLAIPKDTVFVSEKQDPTASVFIETAKGATLNSDQVQAIVHLTSAAVDGLKPTNVSVVDASGNVLSAVGTGVTGSDSKLATDYEKRVGSAVQAMLDRVAGPGNATVAVSATVDQNTGQKVEESFTSPSGAPALSESKNTESYSGTGGQAAGVLGSQSTAVPSDAGNGTFTSDQTTKNNAVNKVTQTTTIPGGTVTRQTISVAVNSSAANGVDMATLKSLVSSAAGVNAARGDVVTVAALPFNAAGATAAKAALDAAKADADAQRTADTIRTLIIAAVVLVLAALLLFLYARRNRRQSREPVDLGERLDPMLLIDPATTALQLPGPPSALEIPRLPDAPMDLDGKRARLESLATHDPEKTADYLRSMMDERSSV
ncbi:flagellar M-ring protein FliF [Paenarthrobacter sp. Z7-10]|uniref:flagellar basal-body MS-ring/collar protein FliF n=1 Tax=Paenarthrobacter sp. Z7-10 TaxID=2787635 RepID=UPI0022A93151|nr:flagellar basal-body MS-ring/collar protein FliF [Paenarthrobacter sp. Z7-10]MCZ2403320.1 flagellar M-ring protein FliF [Paenarthrobacter sp. Z7-10]